MEKHNFSDKLRSLMYPHETQQQFGDRIGLNRNTIAQYLSKKNEKPASVDVIKQICEKCNVSADWLLGLSEVEKIDIDLRTVCEYTGLSEKAINNITVTKVDKDQYTIKTLNALLSNDSACLDFYAALHLMLVAYASWIESKENKSISNPDNDIDDSSLGVDLALFRIQKHIARAIQTLIDADALKDIYHEEEKNNAKP